MSLNLIVESSRFGDYNELSLGACEKVELYIDSDNDLYVYAELKVEDSRLYELLIMMGLVEQDGAERIIGYFVPSPKVTVIIEKDNMRQVFRDMIPTRSVPWPIPEIVHLEFVCPGYLNDKLE